ncbi:MAG: aminopeptidase C [Christensenellales bacterium]|jgi:bleomycin hydrolase
MYTPISCEQLKAFSASFGKDEVNEIRMHAAVKNGVSNAAENHLENANNPMQFSVEIETGKITDQKHSGRCWMFAGLNTLRFEVMKKLNLETFELSQSFTMFYDKLEKANYFLESILQTVSEPLDGRLLAHLLTAPVQDGGQWDMFSALIDKYGIVPKSAMPESFHSGDSGMMNKFLTLKLREDAMILREKAQGGADAAALACAKEQMLCEIYRMLCICLGEPPKTFDFSCRDKDKKFISAKGITPTRFYREYVGQVLDDYVSVINAPTADKPYGKTYTVAFLGNVAGGRSIKYLNLPSCDLKALAIRQLEDGYPVWFGCDVGQMLQRDTGIMGMHTYEYEKLFGTEFGMDKAQRLDYGESVLTHAMVFLGVDIANGKPTRWKVENSWGDKSGQDGYYIMTDEWFDEYNYQVVVNKKYMTGEQKKAYEQEPVVLKPWDPMGSLA